MFPRCFLVAAYLCIQVYAIAQTPAPPPAPPKFVNPWLSITQPNVPADPLELVGNAEPVQGVAQRAAAVKLLRNAQFLSNVRRGAYDLKTRFASPEGTWEIEDSSPGRNIYRWAVQGPSYTAVNLFLDNVIYSNQPATNIPLRVAQVHSAIFAPLPAYGPRATMRMANGNLNGTAVTCVLISHVSGVQPSQGARRWDEYESCMNPESGLLMSSSPVPGLYVLFDYANAQHLGNITFPGRLRISEAGQTVVEAEVVSLTQSAKASDSLYSSAGLQSLGVGFPLTMPWRMQETNFNGTFNPTATNGQLVVVRGMVAPDGQVTEGAVVASSDPAFNQKALDRLVHHRLGQAQEEQSGATPQSHEVYVTTLFITN